jgi:hypothetical protein
MCRCARGRIGSSFKRRVRLSAVSVKLKIKALWSCWFPSLTFRISITLIGGKRRSMRLDS